MQATRKPMVKATKRGVLFLLLLSGTIATSACSSFQRDKNIVHVGFDRGWARQTTDPDYLGHRHPAMITPIVTPDIVVAGNGIDGVVAFRRSSGHRIWKKDVHNGTEGLFLDGDNGLFFGGNDGRFYSIDVLTGNLTWNYPLNSESTAAPTVQGKFIFHMAMNGTLYALEKDSGRVLWVKSKPLKTPLSIRGTTQPVFSDGKVYVGHSDGIFSVYNAVDGSVIWEKQLSERNKFNDIDSRPVVTDMCVLVATYSESLNCLDKATGALRWTMTEGGSARPIFVNNNEIFYTTDLAVYIIDLPSGKIKKSHKVPEKIGIPTGAVPYKSWIIVGYSEGPVVLMDKESGEWVDTFYPGRGVSATPFVDKESGDIFVVSNQANVYKLNVKMGVIR
jgi:outer membrane protein assembly factor BamB